MNTRLLRMQDRLKKCFAGASTHEPDNYGIRAYVSGFHLDNAMGSDPAGNCGEFTVGIQKDDGPIEWFNLASLLDLAMKVE